MSCPDCFRGGRATGEPQGHIETLYGLPTYITGTSTASSTQSTIIFYTDAFGLELVNNKVLADAYAIATGFRVLVPDIIPGGPMSPDVLTMMDQMGAPVSLFNTWGQIKRIAVTLQVMRLVLPFLYRSYPGYAACNKASLDYARKVKADLHPGAKLGAAGFCWGGNQSLRVSAQPAVEGGSERLIDAQFCAHPSGIKLPDDFVNAVMKFKTPVVVAHAENDSTLKTKQVEESEATLRQKVGNGQGENGFNYEIKIYKGVAHGFSVRAVPGNRKEEDGADEAKEQAIAWFKRWL
ncbi:hypothetical protein K491DRAFT_599141 [Lophiostoma macrostomum CBS 122681]|uniref:Dienelactone hydrolase domain-containing protein n=1 Tax=Lophiostoma macrostomum CBS 122681 TaxID=1314788 RepID=A0A6A6T9Q3_9PLEO|nr:hypothetical protein K491DRAFT_599141 [Lophiostoma macrostomum CBS 122681]